jgi:hypothetical protein
MPRRTVDDRFWSKVEGGSVDTCWLWTGCMCRDGYGSFKLDKGSPRRAHRVAYELLVAEIPEGLQLDHLFRVRSCVNPWHLEPVTNRINTTRGQGPEAARNRQLAKTHCKNGHQLSGSNIRTNGRGHRRCLACQREFQRSKSPLTGGRSTGPLVQIVNRVGSELELACGHVVTRPKSDGSRKARCSSCDELLRGQEQADV